MNEVKEMYEKYPYPSRIHYGTFDKTWDGFFRESGINKEDLEGKEILDAGCGTGGDSYMFAHYGGDVTAFDFCEESIRIAEEGKQVYKGSVHFSVDDIFDFKSHKLFDYIFCIGVVHHTEYPYVAFLNLLQYLKPGGVITLGIYNKAGGLRRTYLKRAFQMITFGDEDSLIKLALKWHKKDKNPTDQDKIAMADTYLHPLEQKEYLGTVISWFEENKLEIIGAKPPIKISNYFKGHYHKNYKLLRFFSGIGKRIPNNKLSRAFIQLLWFFTKREGLVITGRKPE